MEFGRRHSRTTGQVVVANVPRLVAHHVVVEVPFDVLRRQSLFHLLHSPAGLWSPSMYHLFLDLFQRLGSRGKNLRTFRKKTRVWLKEISFKCLSVWAAWRSF